MVYHIRYGISYSEEEFWLKLEYEKRLTNDLKNNCKGLYSYLLNK